ncbi:MAG: hypothetical protein R6X29_08240 [Acidimicrobiia bacterium]|jgi:hypothetical protein
MRRTRPVPSRHGVTTDKGVLGEAMVIADWIAVWDATTGDCFYLPIAEARHREVRLRMKPARNGQRTGIRWADDYRNP